MSIGITEILFHQSRPNWSCAKTPPHLLDMTDGEGNDSTIVVDLMIILASILVIRIVTLMNLMLWRIDT